MENSYAYKSLPAVACFSQMVHWNNRERLRGFQSQEMLMLHDEISTLSLNGGHISPPPRAHASLAAPDSTHNSLRQLSIV